MDQDYLRHRRLRSCRCCWPCCDLDSHDFARGTAAFPIVLPAEADVGLVKIEQAIVGDRDATAVAPVPFKGHRVLRCPNVSSFCNFCNDSFDVDDVVGHYSTSKHGSVE
jgi:hypothetical protein